MVPSHFFLLRFVLVKWYLLKLYGCICRNYKIAFVVKGAAPDTKMRMMMILSHFFSSVLQTCKRSFFRGFQLLICSQGNWLYNYYEERPPIMKFSDLLVSQKGRSLKTFQCCEGLITKFKVCFFWFYSFRLRKIDITVEIAKCRSDIRS